mgnify:CR=1 FL=1
MDCLSDAARQFKISAVSSARKAVRLPEKPFCTCALYLSRSRFLSTHFS